MKFHTFGLFITLCFTLSISAQTYRSELDIVKLMIKSVKQLQTLEEELEYNILVQLLTFDDYINRNAIKTFSKRRVTLTCLACRSIVSTVIDLYESGSTKEELSEMAIGFCTMFNVQPYHVCRGFVELNSDIMWHILENQPLVSARAFCGVVLQSDDPTSCPINDDRYDWTLEIPARRKQIIKRASAENGTSVKIVHITDTHYDPAYEDNGLAVCNEPTCCRKGQTEKPSRRSRSLRSYDPEILLDDNGQFYIDIEQVKTSRGEKLMLSHKNSEITDEDRAGHWGDYRNCDSPWWAYEDGIDFITENHNDIEYVYYTGDVIDHGGWETTYEMITESLNLTYTKIKESFKGNSIFPGIGNHESQPTNQFAPAYITDPELSTAWLYKVLADLWSDWLPEDTKTTIMEGGYYTVLVKPGFRIVVLNSNYCYVDNWWIHLDPEYLKNQFNWLIETLLAAEYEGERVHILSHVPTGTEDSLYTCSREYRKITERFSDTIIAEFNGHTHNEEFKIYYNKESDEPYTVAWNGGSLTAYTFVNPNYRIYEVDAETHEVLDAETWVYNLTEANLNPDQRPRWYREYAFKEHYGVDSLSAYGLDGLIQRMITTEKDLLVVDYHRFRGKSAPNWLEGTCDDKCIQSNLCYMVKSDVYDSEKCDGLWEDFNASN